MRPTTLSAPRAAVTFTALAAISALQFGCATAPSEPRSFQASPDVYKVLAENSRFRVIEVTWKPGQRDLMHSHPAAGVYSLTDCRLRAHMKDGSSVTFNAAAGTGSVQGPIEAHSVENIGTTVCKAVMFEPR